jgi:hypothetical protein
MPLYDAHFGGSFEINFSLTDEAFIAETATWESRGIRHIDYIIESSYRLYSQGETHEY